MVESMPKLLAEFTGTFFLVLTIGSVVLSEVEHFGVMAIAMSLMVGIYALGAASGAHFNPAVTTAVLLTGKIQAKEAGSYVAAQLAGALVAAGLYVSLFSQSFNLAPGTGSSWLMAALVELAYTCMLCFTVLNVACTQASAGNQYFGLAIGLVIVSGGYAVGIISGACFNPAVAIAVDASSLDKSFGMCLIWVAAELLGAALAVGLFKVVRPEEFGDAAAKNGIVAKLTAEAIGAYFLTLTIGFNVLKGAAPAAAAYSIAASLTVMIYAVGNCSGAHLNPAVTLAIYLSGRNKIDLTTALKYAAAQTVGATLGALSYVAVLGTSAPLKPGGDSYVRFSIAEVVFTTLLCLTVLCVATVAKPSKDMFGLVIGSVITVAAYAGGAFGVSLNPAVSVGIDLSNAVKGGHFGHCFPYAALEGAGALAAAGLFRNIYPDEYAVKGGGK